MEEKKTSFVRRFFSGPGALVIILAALVALFSIWRPDAFPVWENIYNLIRTSAINGVAALGIMVPIICGGVDLSVGSVICSTCMITSYLCSGQYGNITSVPVAMLVSIIFALLIGFINGFLINDGHVPPFITTIATQIIIRNLIMYLTEARIIALLPEVIPNMGTTNVLGLPLLAFVWFALAIICWLMMKFTSFGRNIFAVGSNSETARLSGISLRQTRCGAWMWSALYAAFSGILLLARQGNGIPSSGTGYEGDAIASAVVGGTSMSGGEGNVIGVVLGATILQTIRNGGVIIGINYFVLTMIVGFIIIGAVLLDSQAKKRV